jgi:hypothetical protein
MKCCISATDGKKLLVHPGEYVPSKGIISFVHGDQPAIAKLQNFKGHQGKSGCRHCLIEGITPQGRSTTVYFPLKYPDNQKYEKRIRSVKDYNLNDLLRGELKRTPSSVNDALEDLEHAMAESASNAHINKLQRESGINGPCIWQELEHFKKNFTKCFPVDIMHAMFLNVARRLFTMWYGEFPGCSAEDEFVLSAATWKEIGAEMENQRQSVPLKYGRPIRNIEKHWKGYKSEEWKNWMIRFSIPLLHNRLPNKYLVPWTKLVEATKLLLCADKKPLELTDLDFIERSIIGFYLHFERLVVFASYILYIELICVHSDYYCYKSDRLHFCLSVFHYLLHVPESILSCGPVSGFWQYPMERYCGLLLLLVKSKRMPHQNLVRNMELKRNQHLFSVLYTYDATDPSVEKDNLHMPRSAESTTVMVENARVCDRIGYTYTLLVAASRSVKDLPCGIIDYQGLLATYYQFSHIVKENLCVSATELEASFTERKKVTLFIG